MTFANDAKCQNCGMGELQNCPQASLVVLLTIMSGQETVFQFFYTRAQENLAFLLLTRKEGQGPVFPLSHSIVLQQHMLRSSGMSSLIFCLKSTFYTSNSAPFLLQGSKGFTLIWRSPELGVGDLTCSSPSQMQSSPTPWCESVTPPTPSWLSSTTA